jgi:hypothetical protein
MSTSPEAPHQTGGKSKLNLEAANFILPTAASFTDQTSTSTDHTGQPSTGNPPTDTASTADPPTTFRPLNEFTLFPKLPVELQLKIWKEVANVPRLVIWILGGSRIPAILQANRESRSIFKKRQHRTIVRPLFGTKQDNYKLIIDFEKDILYRKCTLPKITSMSPTSQSLGKFSWMKDLKYFGINLHDSASLIEHYHVPGLWLRLKYMLPNLKQLIVVVYVNPNKDTLWEDMVDANTFNEAQQGMVDVISTDLLDAK